MFRKEKLSQERMAQKWHCRAGGIPLTFRVDPLLGHARNRSPEWKKGDRLCTRCGKPSGEHTLGQLHKCGGDRTCPRCGKFKCKHIEEREQALNHFCECGKTFRGHTLD